MLRGRRGRAVQAERRHGVAGEMGRAGGRRGGEGGGGQQGCGMLGLLVLLQGAVARGAHGHAAAAVHVGGLGQDGRQPGRVVRADAGAHDAGQLDARGRRVAGEGARGRHAAAGGLVDRARDGGGHYGGVAGRGRAGGHRGRPLAAVAAVAQLVVVQAARELRLLQVGGDVLVGHLLQAGLEQVDFLYEEDRRVSTLFSSHDRKGHRGRHVSRHGPPDP